MALEAFWELGSKMRVGYARVSSEDQDTAIQREELERAGCDVIRYENASGSNRDGRPQLAIAMEILRAGDTLVVTKLDRLARNTLDMLSIINELGARDVGVKSLAESWCDTSTPAGKFMITVFAGVAQFERERIKERQAAGIAKAKAEGKYKGRPPLAPEKAAKIKALAGADITPTEIARIVGVGRSTVYRVLGDDDGADGCTEKNADSSEEPSNTEDPNEAVQTVARGNAFESF